MVRRLPFLLALLLVGCDDRIDCDWIGTREEVRKVYVSQAYRLVRGAGSPAALKQQRGEASFTAMIRFVQDHLNVHDIKLLETATLERSQRGARRERHVCTGIIDVRWPPVILKRFAEGLPVPTGFEPTVDGDRVRHRIVYETWHGRRGRRRAAVQSDVLDVLARALGDADPFAPLHPEASDLPSSLNVPVPQADQGSLDDVDARGSALTPGAPAGATQGPGP